jgi:sugar phosphate isomerase/epimerase
MMMKLSFTTLGCPGWNWGRILDKAKALGFQGVEVRGILRELDNGKLEPFRDANIPATKTALQTRGLSIPCLDTSCTFLSETPFDETLRAGRESIDIAYKLGIPYIRVFGDRIPKGMGEKAAVDRVVEGMQSLASYAEDKGVAVLQETHGNFAESRLLLAVFDSVKSPAAGVLWDIANPYEFGETVSDTWSRLKPLVRHTHIKDVVVQNGQLIPCLPGKGKVPIGEVVKTLRDAGYDGWLSFEWEKMWHGTIEEPEIALPFFMDYIKKYM